MANPNPVPKVQKGAKKPEGSGRKAGQVNQITREGGVVNAKVEEKTVVRYETVEERCIRLHAQHVGAKALDRPAPLA